MKHKSGTFLLCCFFLLLTNSCKKNDYQFSQGEIFHTTYHIKYQYNRPLDNEILNKLKTFDLSLNPFNRESLITKINENRDSVADDFLITVIKKSEEVSEKTGGSFDITCAPFINLWGFGFEKEVRVSQDIIDSLKAFTGYQKLHINGNTIHKDDPRLIINCSAIAKGYSCDVVADLLESYGIKNYMIEIGGEIRAKGVNDRNECWRIEITKPQDDTTGIISDRQEVIGLCNNSLATSGNYRNFYIKDGKKYAHTIDPETGYPSQQNILSATVIAPDCMTADAYATAFMTMGLDASCRLAESLENIEYYFVYTDQEGNPQVKYSKGMEEQILEPFYNTNK